MKVKQKSKQWAESRGAVLVGAPLKPIHDAERLYRVTLQKARQKNLLAKHISLAKLLASELHLLRVTKLAS